MTGDVREMTDRVCRATQDTDFHSKEAEAFEALEEKCYLIRPPGTYSDCNDKNRPLGLRLEIGNPFGMWAHVIQRRNDGSLDQGGRGGKK